MSSAKFKDDTQKQKVIKEGILAKQLFEVANETKNRYLNKILPEHLRKMIKSLAQKQV